MSEKSKKVVDIEPAHESKPKRTDFLKNKRVQYAAVALAILLLVLPTIFLTYAYATTPESIRKPQFDHYHFRMQIIVDGESEDFGGEEYQKAYAKDLCTADLTEDPIHFHDQKDQFVHIHWNGMTGGLVMKNYGWNYIGGTDGTLGYRMDNMPLPKAVPTKGKMLPQSGEGSKFFVYIGNENSYEEKSFEDWKNQDLETFFGKSSSVPDAESIETSLLNTLFPKVAAHGDEPDGHHGGAETEEQKLTRINNLIGNVVIFVQNEAPNENQIKERFNNLVPLSESTCGG